MAEGDFDETYELEHFFQKGIETLAGQRARIRQLERMVRMMPAVICHKCEATMNTVQARKEGDDEHVRYVCTMPTCDNSIWVLRMEP